MTDRKLRALQEFNQSNATIKMLRDAVEKRAVRDLVKGADGEERLYQLIYKLENDRAEALAKLLKEYRT